MKQMQGVRLKLNLLLSATLISSAGSAMSILALGKLFYDQSGSAAGFAWAFALEQVVQVFGMYCAGPISDRMKPKALATFADLVRAFVFILSAILVLVSGNPMFAYATVIVGGFLKPFHRAAVFKLLPTLANGNELFKLNSAYGSAVQMGGLIGSAAAGGLMLIIPTAYLVLIDGISYSLSAVILLSVAKTNEPTKTTDGIKGTLTTLTGYADWRDLLILMKTRLDLSKLTIFNSFDYVVVAVFNVLLVPYVESVLRLSSLYISVIDIFFAAGSLLLVYLQRHFALNPKSKISLLIGYLCMSVGFIGLGWTSHIAGACLATLTLGIGQRLVFTSNTYLLQLATPDSYRGRIAVVRLGLASCAIGLFIAPVATVLNQNITSGLYGFALVIFGFMLLNTLTRT